MPDRPNPLPPMRIEMATSETEGAETITWIDPAQVVGAIARSQPRETFGRFVEPRLAELAAGRREGTSEPRDGGLPERVATVLERLRQVHGRLYRENRSPLRDPRSVRLAATMVEGDRVYFVKAIRCWVFRVREGVAVRIGGEDEGASNPGAAALGMTGRLSLAVTSIPYEPSDVIVLLAAEGGDPPDPRAVASVLEQTQDLKRACDGLVNLFGLDAGGAGAIALRFVPILAARPQEADAAVFFEDLSRELATDNQSAAGAASSPPFGEEIALPAFLEEIGTAVPPGDSGGASVERRPLEAAPEAALAPMAAPPPPQEPAGQSAFVGAADGASRPEAAERSPSPQPWAPSDARPASTTRRVGRGTLAVIGGVIVVLLGIAGIPRGIHLLRGSVATGDLGVLRLDSVPPARAVFVDGVDQGTGTPAILEGVAPGVHRIRFDLGPYGAVEQMARLRKGETVEVRARGVGSLDVGLAEVRPDSRVWLRGRAQTPAPCRVDTLTAGWHEIFYEDDRIALWQRPVLIRAGETTRLRIPNAFATDRAHLRIESWSYEEGEGLRETEGSEVTIDGETAGVTPLDTDVTPGLHGIRIDGATGQTWTEVCDFKAGSSRVIAPRFGMGQWPEIRHREPGRVLRRGPILLTVEIVTEGGVPARNPRLQIPSLGAGARDLPLSPVDVTLGTYVSAVDPETLPVGKPVAYYFTVQTPGGETICSELYRLTIVEELSGLNP